MGLVSRGFTPRARLGPTSNGLPFGNRCHPPGTIRHPFDHICPEHGIEHGFTQPGQLYFSNGQVECGSRTIAEAKARRYCYRTASEFKKHPQVFSLVYPRQTLEYLARPHTAQIRVCPVTKRCC